MVTYHFDKARLSPVMEDALEAIIMEFQATGIPEDIDFDIFEVDFPYKFCLRLPWCDSYVLWNPREQRYNEIIGTQVKRPWPKSESKPESD